MRSSRSSAVTQFREAFSSSSSRAVLRRCATKSRCARTTARRRSAVSLARARALFLPRHLLGPRRGLERLRGFPRRLRLLDARALRLHLRRLRVRARLEVRRPLLAKRVELRFPTRADARCTCPTLGSNAISGSSEDGVADARAAAEVPNARAGTAARAQREARHAGQPAVVNSRTTRRSIALARGGTAPGEAIGHDLERSLRRRVSRARDGKSDHARRRSLHRGAWLGVGLVPLRSRGRGARGSG